MSEPNQSQQYPRWGQDRPSGWGPAPSGANLPPGGAPEPGQPAQVRPPSHPGRPDPPTAEPPSTEEPPARLSAAQFKPKRSPLPAVLIVVLAALVVGGLVYFGTRPAPLPIASPTPSPADRATSNITVGAPSSIGLHSDQFEGTWSILNSTWDATGVTITTRIELTSGSLGFSFFCLDYVTSDQYEQTDLGAPGTLQPGLVRAGQSVEGTIRFDKPRNDTMVVLADSFGRQITALLVKA